MDIDKIFDIYQKENSDLTEYIEKIVDERKEAGDWDLGIGGQSSNLLPMLMYEYASSIEKLTNGKLTAKYVVDKLSSQMGKFRIGDFKLGEDDNITYDNISVTSDEYKKRYRINKKFGAHAIEYNDEQGKNKTLVVLFDNRQVAFLNGTQQSLSGIDLQDLSDIRHTVFHEWTHIMEKCMIKASQLSKEDIIFKDGESIFINSYVSPILSNQEYKDYVSNVDNLLASDEEIPFEGIYTIELNDNKSPNKRIMHNQISEGATEFIARKVLETIGEKVKDPKRYAEQVRIVGDIFKRNGLADMITKYFTEPNKIIRTLESKRVQNKDMLHYISDYINSSHISRIFNRFKIDENGNVKLGMITKLAHRFKMRFSNKELLALPKENLNYDENVSEDKENAFLENIKTSPEEFKIRKKTLHKDVTDYHLEKEENKDGNSENIR